MARISGVELGKRLCKALGLDPDDYVSIVVECNVREAALITLKRMVRDNELENVSEILEEYELVSKDDAEDIKEGLKALADADGTVTWEECRKQRGAK